MFTLVLVVLFFSVVAAKTGDDHPTLPELWNAQTVEPGAPGSGKGTESYMFNAVPTPDAPSALWSRYGDCKRLIHINNNADEKRYLLGCDGNLDCCWESQSGNQVEFQIPNVHYSNPSKKVEVTSSRANVTSFGNVMETDMWSWATESGAQEWNAYTVDCPDCYNGVQLVAWESRAMKGSWYKIQFKGYRGIDPKSSEAATFAQSFEIPQQCLANNLLQCDTGSKKGRSFPPQPKPMWN
jgi:hypothetical protein